MAASRSVCLALTNAAADLVGPVAGLIVSPLPTVSPMSQTATAAIPKSGAPLPAPSSNPLVAIAALAWKSPSLTVQSVESDGSAIQLASLIAPQASQAALSGTLLSASADPTLWKILAATTGRQPLSPMGTGTLSPNIATQPSALQRSTCASPPVAAVTLAAYPTAAK